MISGTDEPSEGSSGDRLVVEGGIEDQASEELPVLGDHPHLEVGHQDEHSAAALGPADPDVVALGALSSLPLRSPLCRAFHARRGAA